MTLISSPASQTDLNPQDSVSTVDLSPLVIEDEIAPHTIALESQSKPSSLTWKVFASTFVTIFLAELGDKTQVSTLLMTAEFHAPWVVFAGAACALITTSLLGVLVGCWLAARLSPKMLDTSAGITLAMISLGLLWDVIHL